MGGDPRQRPPSPSFSWFTPPPPLVAVRARARTGPWGLDGKSLRDTRVTHARPGEPPPPSDSPANAQRLPFFTLVSILNAPSSSLLS